MTPEQLGQLYHGLGLDTVTAGSAPLGPSVDVENLNAEDDGIYLPYPSRLGGVQVAGAVAIPLGIPNPSALNWENAEQLASGALRLSSGQIITGATLLSALDAHNAQSAVNDAIAKFDLDPTRASDVLAATAYAWSMTNLPMNYWDVPSDGGPVEESAAEAVMRLELVRPGTVYLAAYGDKTSGELLNLAVQEGIDDAGISESSARPANAPAALQTTSASARAALGLQRGDNMQAHHLIPANIVGINLPIANLASQAGWTLDLPSNLIALPGDAQTQAKLAAEGVDLPIHNTSHPDYDIQTEYQIFNQVLNADSMTPLVARSVFDYVGMENRLQIMTGVWNPRLH
jgi:hypothetical protein